MFVLLVVPASHVSGMDLGNSYMTQVQSGAGIGSATMPQVIGKVIKVILSILGLVALVLFIIGGFQWMTSGGNKEKIQGAQKLMGAAVIGMVIIIIAYAASAFIVNKLANVTDATSS